MTPEELKQALAEEIKAFKETFKGYVDEAGLKKSLEDFTTDVMKKFDASNEELKSQITDLTKIVGTQGAEIVANNLASKEVKKTFKQEYSEKLEEITDAISKGQATQIYTSKDVLSTNITDGTLGFRDSAVGQIARGVAFVRDLFQVVMMGSNTQGTARWFEQTAVTNNASNVAEATASGTASAITWAEKTITGKRIMDWIKIGMDQLKDVDFIQGEVQNLVNRNMRLKENDQLINGLSTGNEIAGLLSYAKEFVTTGIEISGANLIDLVGKIRTQIDTDLKGLAMPNYWIANREDTDLVRFAKDKDNAYLFQNWALGLGNVAVGGMELVENPLMTANTLIAGDFSLATLYVWDDLVIEFAQIEDDKKTGKITVIAYMRENLRVKDCEKNGIVKVSDVGATIQAITAVTA
jgi:HK97 family phage major capsid protein